MVMAVGDGRRLGPFGSPGEVLAEFRPEVVLAQYGQMGVRMMAACRAADVPLVVHFHGFDAYRHDVLRQFGESYQALFQQAQSIIAVSLAMVRQLVSLGAPPERIVCNSCGVNTSAFHGARPADSAPAFLSVGRFVEKKGPHLTILAFAKVLAKHPAARLRMIGDGPLLGACADLVADLGISHAVTLLGMQEHQRVAEEMRAARCFVQHSVRAIDGDCEGTPVSVLEASASGLPVVSTRHCGINEAVLDGKTGWLVDERDTTAMAERMLWMLASPDEAAAMGIAGQLHMREHYELADRIATLAQVLSECTQFKSPETGNSDSVGALRLNPTTFFPEDCFPQRPHSPNSSAIFSSRYRNTRSKSGLTMSQ
jgi:glycosyltransferase involved in cell wall biosynthesis